MEFCGATSGHRIEENRTQNTEYDGSHIECCEDVYIGRIRAAVGATFVLVNPTVKIEIIYLNIKDGLNRLLTSKRGSNPRRTQ